MKADQRAKLKRDINFCAKQSRSHHAANSLVDFIILFPVRYLNEQIYLLVCSKTKVNAKIAAIMTN